MSTKPLAGCDLLGLKGLDRETLGHYLTTAAEFEKIIKRDIKKVPTLKGKSVITLFYENSTRTRTSFEAAGKYMSGLFNEVLPSALAHLRKLNKSDQK